MYKDFFGFRETPFAIEPNPRFILLSEEHQEALATLVYALEQREGWALLVGYPGVGKTTLIIALLRELADQVIAGVVTNPRLSPLDFFNLVGLELGMEGPFVSKGGFLLALGELINRCRQEGKALLLVVDEAHSLTDELLEELRLLGNLDEGSPRVLNIFLVGQPELVRLLKENRSRGLLQRLRRYHLLKPLNADSTAAYVRHRLKVAGGDPETFNPAALVALHELTKGNCRLINALCDDALLLAFTREQRRVGREMILEAAAENPYLQEEALDSPPQAPPQPPPAPAPAAPPSEKASAPVASLAPAPRLPAAKPAAPRPSASPAPARSAPEAAPPPATPAPAEAPSKPAERPGLASRFARSLSRETPGSFWRRLVFLLLLMGLTFGGYYYLATGGYGQLKLLYWRVTGQVPVVIPPEPPRSEVPRSKSQPEGVRDWGPVVPEAKEPAGSPGQGGG